MIDLWEIQSKKVHNSKEAVKQQKRKAKAAINACGSTGRVTRPVTTQQHISVLSECRRVNRKCSSS